MNPLTTQLLLVLTAAVFINALVSLALYLDRKEPLTRGQLAMWAATLLGFVVQGLLSFGWFQILGAASAFFVSATAANMLATLSGAKVRWTPYLIGLAAGVALSTVAWALGLPFVAEMGPTVIAVAAPLLVTAVTVLATRWSECSISMRGLAITSVAYGLHMLDFAVLGDKPAMMPTGFSFALLCVFSLSIFLPAVITEQLTRAAERTATEMDAARRIQLGLLPRSPTLPRLELACYMQPADQVGGDYYDICHVGDHSWILLGDVTGHGLSSGLVMLMAQSIISAIVHTQEAISPRELNILANRVLHKNLERMGEDRMMTIVSIAVRNGREIVLSGWHDNLFLFRKATGKVETVSVEQFPFALGFLDVPADSVSEVSYELSPGDTLFIITDGVTEAARGGDYQQGTFNEERLIAFIAANATRPLEEVKADLCRQLAEFTLGVFHDDVTFIIARLAETPA